MLLQFSFLLLPIAATCGWFVGRREKTKLQLPQKNDLRQGYFKGLNYLINEEPDKAVDVFVELLEVDSDTVETHLALGNLFRRRGEVDRAIRLHQNLIARPQLDKRYKAQALSALGQDYLRAGVLDRAERLFLELVEMGQEDEQSLQFLLHIYQQEKDWRKAVAMARKLEIITGESMRNQIAHYYCELSNQMRENGSLNEAYNYLKRAQLADPMCVRANILRGRMEAESGNFREAIRCYQRIKNQDADFISEIIDELGECYRRMNAEPEFVKYLQDCLREKPRIALVLAVSEYLRARDGDKSAIEFIAQQIRQQPSLLAVRHLAELYIQNSQGDTRDKLDILRNLIDNLLKDATKYRCYHCGYACNTLFWVCPSCHTWSSVKPAQGL